MPKTMIQYIVFIGGRAGLDDEQRQLGAVLRHFSWRLANEGIGFRSVGWLTAVEESKPLEPQVEEDLRQSDFAVFLIDDRWSSSGAVGPMSVLAQQWALAEELYRANKLLGIAVLFGKVSADRLAAPDDQLKAVLDFRRKVEAEDNHYIGDCTSLSSLSKEEREALDDWLGSLTIDREMPVFAGISAKEPGRFRIGAPNADYWIAEAWANVDGDTDSRKTALYCATNAVEAARGDVDQAKASNILGIAQFRLGRIDGALATLTAMADKLATAFGGDRREWHATALMNKGLMLEALGRGSEAITVHDDIIARFGAAYEQSVRDLVARAQARKERLLDAAKAANDASKPDDAPPPFPERELEEALDSLIEAVGKPLK